MEYDVFGESELLNGKMVAVRAGSKAIVLCRSTEGVVSALEDRCSHAEVKLSRGLFDGAEVTCPAHGARFEAASGKPLCMPAISPVRTFPVRVSDGRIWVTVE